MSSFIKYILLTCVLFSLAWSCSHKQAEAPVVWSVKADSLLHDSAKVSLLVDSLKQKILSEGPAKPGINDLNRLSRLCHGASSLWLAEAAYDKSRQLNDTCGQAEAICSKAIYYESEGNHELAAALVDSCYAIARKHDCKALQAQALLQKGVIYLSENHQSMAEGFFGQGLTMARETGDRPLEALVLRTIGNMYFMQDDYDSSITYYNHAIEIARAIHDKSQEAACLNNIGDNYRMKSEHPKAISYFNQGITLSTAIGDKHELGSILSNLGNTYYLIDENDKALECYNKSLAIAVKMDDESQISFCYSSLGEVCRMQNDYARALHYFSQSMAIAKKTHSEYRIADCLSSMGEIYSSQDDDTKALDYFEQAIAIGKRINDKNRVAYCLSSMGQVYISKATYAKALDYFRQAIIIANEIGDKIRLADCLSSIGKVYVEQNNTAGDQSGPEVAQRYADALDYFKKAQVIAEEIGDKNQTVDCLASIGGIYMKTGNLAEAQAYGEKSLALSKICEMPGNVETSAELLYKVYGKKNNYKGAFEMLQLYLEMKDSINGEESVKNFVSQEFNLKNEELKLAQSKKDILYKAEQIKKETELKRQKTIRYALTAGFVLLLVLAIVIFRNGQQNKKKNRIITLQKQEVESKSHLLEQRNKEMMDSIHYAQRIQHALMASESLLSNNLSAADAGYFVYFNPKDVVSGDFYWATKSHGKFYLAIADSTGHGVPGAFMSLLNISFLNEAINEKGLQKPDEVLAHVRNRLIQSFAEDGSSEGGKDGMDCSLLCFDFAGMTLEFSCANNPIILIRNNTLLEQPSDRMPVGKSPKEHEPYTLQRLSLQKGDMIYAFTDGYIDQFGGPRSKKFMYKKLNELLLLCHHSALPEQKDIIEQTFISWKGNLEQVDDVLIAGIRI